LGNNRNVTKTVTAPVQIVGDMVFDKDREANNIANEVMETNKDNNINTKTNEHDTEESDIDSKLKTTGCNTTIASKKTASNKRSLCQNTEPTKQMN